ncbi:MAG: porin [Sphingomonadaceae bacterium]
MLRERLSASLFALVISGALVSPALAKDGVEIGQDGIEASLGDGAVEIRLGGKIHFDGYAVDGEGEDYTGADFRRARPDLRIEIADVLKIRVEREFTRTDQWRNLYAEIEPVEGFTLRGGQFNAPFGIEHLQSANTIPFAERSLSAALAQDYALGIQAGYAADRFTVKAAYVGNAIGGSNAGKGVAARATWLPVDRGKTKVHLGLAFDLRDFDNRDELRFSGRAGTRFADAVFQTDRLDDLRGRTGVSGEVAILRGPFAAQAQYIRQWIDRDGKRTRKASAGHVQASWMVTGEDYRYSSSGGLPSGPRIEDGKMGVELAARFGWANADFVRDEGAKARALDLSAGLHLNGNLKLMLSAGRAWFGRRETGDRQARTTGVLRFVAAF